MPKIWQLSESNVTYQFIFHSIHLVKLSASLSAIYNVGVGCICKLLLTLTFGTDLAYKQVFTVYTLTVVVTVIY